MSRRLSARLLITVSIVFTAMAAAFLLTTVVRESLSDAYPLAIAEATASAWTIGVLLIVLAAAGGWVLAGYVVAPLARLSRDVSLAARTRALAEEHAGDLAEVNLLRTTLQSVLADIAAQVNDAVVEKRRLLGLFDAITEGIVEIGPTGRLLHVNAAARALLGLPHHPEGQTAASLVRHAKLRELLEEAARGQQLAAAEVLVESRQLLLAPHPLASAAGEQRGAVITVMDLTEIRRLENVRRDFVANVSHELKTPLTSIRGYTETLISDDMPRDAQLQFLEIIHKNATRIQRIVEELLDLSRLQSGGWTPDLQDVDLGVLIRDAWSSCEAAATKKRIHFAITGEPAQVLADPGGLQQVFSNVLENAIRYSHEDGAIRVAFSTVGDLVDVRVEDTGIGIPAQSLPRIFERFYRVDAARSRAEGGTGLGLSIVKHLVESMGGSVSASSVLGAGTTVRLHLPRSHG